MSSTECPADATESNVDSEDKTTVEKAEEEESESNKTERIKKNTDEFMSFLR